MITTLNFFDNCHDVAHSILTIVATLERALVAALQLGLAVTEAVAAFWSLAAIHFDRVAAFWNRLSNLLPNIKSTS